MDGPRSGRRASVVRATKGRQGVPPVVPPLWHGVIALSLRTSINVCVQSNITCLNETLHQANPLATNARQPNVCTEIV